MKERRILRTSRPGKILGTRGKIVETNLLIRIRIREENFLRETRGRKYFRGIRQGNDPLTC